jgi:hypothetical protein
MFDTIDETFIFLHGQTVIKIIVWDNTFRDSISILNEWLYQQIEYKNRQNYEDGERYVNLLAE